MAARVVSWCRVAGAVLAAVLLPLEAWSQTDPATQLQQFRPDVFSATSTQTAAVWGLQAVRIVAPTPALQQLGFQPDDVIIAVQGRSLGGRETLPDSDAVVYTVVRPVAGQRPVLDAATVGRSMLTEFTSLPEAQRSPMRLTRMVANAWTLMQEGRGVLLLPADAGAREEVWLQWATPLPAAAEQGVARVAAAVAQRVDLPVVEDEATAARRAYEEGKVLVAQERAGRAVLQWIVDPANRQSSPGFTSLVQLYIDATVAVAERRAELLRPAPRFGVFVEGSYAFVQKMLPQETLMEVENSNGWAGRVGLRTRVVRWLDVQVSFGQVASDFADEQGRTRIATTLRPLLFELAYRPVVLSRLKPLLRAGIGWYFLDTSVHRDDGVAVFEGTQDTWGLEIGGGLDAFSWTSQKLRGTVMVSFRLLEYRFAACDPGGDCATVNWPEAENLPLGSNFDPNRPTAFLDAPPNDPYYTYNLNGWMLGFMLTRDF